MVSANIYFNDDDSAYFIKFGKKEHLEELKSGTVRFSAIENYRKRKKSAIFDKYEGIRCLKHLKNDRIEYAYINSPVFISCFSYFKRQDVINNKILSPQILKEKEWEYVLFITDSEQFRNNVENALSDFTRESRPVTYLDHAKDYDNLTVFNKSDEYEYEKEFRFSFYPKKEQILMKNENPFVNIKIPEFKGIITPAKEFAACFTVEK